MSVRLAPDSSPPLVNGLMVGGGQVYGTVLSLCLGSLAKASPMATVGILVGGAAMSGITCLFVKVDHIVDHGSEDDERKTSVEQPIDIKEE